jgi:hypothetical protein
MIELEEALDELANRFEMGGEAIWTGYQVADALRRYKADRNAVLSNRDDEEDEADGDDAA